MSSGFGVSDLAKYPFLKDAGEYVRELDIPVTELWNPGMRTVVLRARDRILEAIEAAEVTNKTIEKEVEVLSFPVAMLLLKSLGAEHFAGRYSLAEAVRAEKLLQQDHDEVVKAVFEAVASTKLLDASDYPVIRDYRFKLPVAEYLKRATVFNDSSWKLVNRPVRGGYVYLNKKDTIRLLREEIRRLVIDRIKRLPKPTVGGELQEVMNELAAKIPPPPAPRAFIKRPEDYPPCLKFALATLQGGGNVPHYGRFLITTYLLKAGKTVDDVVNLFPRVPDFNEKVTRYQVEHIGGLRGGKVQYNVPSCRTLQTHRLCRKDEVRCYNIRNPIQYPSRFAPTTLKKNIKQGKAIGK